jgi:hypothetical protein
MLMSMGNRRIWPRSAISRKRSSVGTRRSLAATLSYGFMAPFVIVTRKSDGAKGSLEFTHNPRFYFNFAVD